MLFMAIHRRAYTRYAIGRYSESTGHVCASLSGGAVDKAAVVRTVSGRRSHGRFLSAGSVERNKSITGRFRDASVSNTARR